jgi:hypothetical protein
MRRVILLSAIAFAALGGSPSAGGGEPQAPCAGGVSTGVFHSYSVCNMARNIWQVVTDEYYTCPDRSVRPVRVHTIDTTQPCDPKRNGVPPPTGAQVIRDLGPGDRFAEAAGHFIQMECISGIWHRAYYQRHRLPDGTFRISRPASRLESTNVPCDQPQPPLLQGVAPDAQPAGASADQIRVPAGLFPRAGLRFSIPAPTQQQSQAPAKKSIVGVVLPETAVARAGTAHITGTVTTEPERYKNVPGLMVQTIGEFELPVDANGRASLGGVLVDAGGGQPRAASEPFVLALNEVKPGTQPEIPVSVDTSATAQTPPTSAIRLKEVSAAEAPVPGASTPEAYATSSLCETGQVARITGPFDGNGATTAVRFDETPARVIAESGGTAFVEAPSDLPAGLHAVRVQEQTPQGAVQVELPVATMSLGMAADRTDLMRGDRTNFTVVVNGPEALPRELWQDGTLELRIVRESQNIKMNDEKNGVIVKQLRRRDFVNGPYTYKGRIQSLSAGGFRITGILTPKLNPVKGKLAR